MGFLSPKVPDPPPPPPRPANPASAPIAPEDTGSSSGLAPTASSLISTSVAGLKRRATTQRTSLIGGGS